MDLNHHLIADPYAGNEDQTGKGIVASGRSRSSFWVTSKLWNSDHRPAEAEMAIKKTISDLQSNILTCILCIGPLLLCQEKATSWTRRLPS
jgi:diketogulonate reductase-like aldo/keto reductase